MFGRLLLMMSLGVFDHTLGCGTQLSTVAYYRNKLLYMIGNKTVVAFDEA
jgi:hypothetical protein